MRYVFGDYSLDTQRYELRRAGALVPLRPKVFHLLTYLLTHRDRVIPRQELCAHLWPQQFISDATLDACLAQARQAVGDNRRTQHVIQTRHGYGYRFVAAVEAHDHGAGEDGGHSRFPIPRESAEAEPAQVRVCSSPPCTLAGERKTATVLVCSLANAATLAQRLETEALHQRMQAFFALVLEEVERYGGTLQRVLDDSALALFGAPLAHEDHAQRAVLAALGLQQRLGTWRADPAGPQEELAVRIGLHTGQIVIGSLGTDRRLTFTPVGDTTHLAAWLAQQAAPSTILVSAATARLVQGVARLETNQPGLSPEPCTLSTIYKLLGLRPPRTPLASPGERPLSPFVGRQLELDTLRALLTRVKGGQGQVVSLVGEPGMGKTRLAYEFWHSLGTARMTYLEGRCHSYSQGSPYFPLRELLQHACGVTEEDPPAAITAHVHGYLQEIGLSPAAEAPYLLHLLGVPDATARLAETNPQTRRSQTFAALHHLLLRLTQRQPLVLVLENLHWSDTSSQEYITELVERLAGVPLMLLVTFRPGYRPPWMDKSYATQLTLPQLDRPDSQRVVQAVLPMAQLSEHLLQDILTKAGGNPLFLEELAWAVREQGERRLPQELPSTVQAVLAARIDCLPPEAKHLLQSAAVIGPDVPWPLLKAVAEGSEDELRRTCLRLQAAEFLYETRLVPEGTYTFKHALTHEVANGSLLQERRRALHARIVEAIETLYAHRLTDQVERLAHHAFRGELWEKAVAYLRQAGDKALARSAYREAALYFEQALAALHALPESRPRREEGVDLRLDLRAALIPLGEFGQILAHLNEAETLAMSLDDQWRLGRVICYLANCFSQMGDYDRAMEFGQRALAKAKALGDFAIRVQTHYFLAQTYCSLGDYRQAMEVVQWNVASLEGELHRERCGLPTLAAVVSRAVLLKCLAEVGGFAEGRVRGEEAIRIAEASQHAHSCVVAYLRLGGLYLQQGELHQARSLLECSLERWQAGNLQPWFPPIASDLGYARVLTGQVAEGMPLLEQAFEQSTSKSNIYGRGLAMSRLSEALLLTGRRHEAMAMARLAFEWACTRKQQGYTAWTLRLLGTIAAHGDSRAVEEAETSYCQALVFAQALGMRPLQAHCHRGLGMLYAKTGLHERACAELSMAIEMYRGMEMTLWLPETEVALAQVDA